jgi:hypothetical protein
VLLARSVDFTLYFILSALRTTHTVRSGRSTDASLPLLAVKLRYLSIFDRSFLISFMDQLWDRSVR